MSIKLLRMPTYDAEGTDRDLFFVVPDHMDLKAAEEFANKAIADANAEDFVSVDNCCLDGLSVADSIKRRLVEAGFLIPTMVDTSCWDKYEKEMTPVAKEVGRSSKFKPD